MTPAEASLLNKGLYFVPSIGIDVTTLLTDLRMFGRNVALKLMHLKDAACVERVRQGSSLKLVENELFNTDFSNNNIFFNLTRDEFLAFEDESCHELPAALVSILSLVYGAVLLLGIAGNLTLIVIVLKHRQMHNITNILIVNLSFSDLLMSIMCLPFTLVYTLMDHWIFGEAMCKLNPMVQCLSVSVSGFSLVLIASERHQLIVNSHGWRPNNRHAYLGIAAIWILAFLASLPLMIFQVLTDEPFRNLSEVLGEHYDGKYACTDNFPSESFRLCYTTCLLMIQYLLPLCIIFICYLKIHLHLKHHQDVMGRIRDNKRKTNDTHKVNIMLIAIVSAFAICWLPLNIFNIIFDWNHEIIPSCSHNYMFLICHVVAMISTCVNPVFYGLLNKNFRRDLNIMFRFSKSQPRKEGYETTAMSAVHTEICHLSEVNKCSGVS
ncbi:neuropeptide Y receptor type 1-like [Protopterus annectens]|uniref:neuropeptide Y receptor type 1-like n=1 Tax=Protopterus annectens TaxID=7888 RepID=UPI001CFA357E|nr:neuropeptide Y receptor type 1-like [Protopterus annectens]